MKKLFILEILLLSQKERKAKKVEFDRHRTLIYGKNHTGKSSLMKSIYWAFGAEPLFNTKFKNANVSVLVKFELNDEKFQILRDGKRFSIYDTNSNLLGIFNSVTKELGPFLSNLFNFKPLFQTQKSGFITPPPAYLILPFYVDQDESWSKSWSSFRSLQQVKDYRNQCINYHSGIRPNKYYETKKELDIYLKVIEETDKEQKLTGKILDDVKSKLSQTQFNININDFKEEITQLLTELEKIKKKEEILKSDLLDLYHLKASYDTQINIVKQAILESHKDLQFASDKLPKVIGCPTCGAEYENSFSERFEIAQDEQKSKDLLIELNKEAKEINDKIIFETDRLSTTSTEALRIDKILEEKKGDLKLKDVIESSGKNQIKSIFTERYSKLEKTLVENIIEKEKLEKKLKELDSRKRRKEIVDFYKTTMTSFLKKLDIHSLTEDEYKSITTKIEIKETGSSRPRALIAYYFTFFHLMKKYSSSTYFPLIVDSPNQQDQDVENIDKIMTFIQGNQPKETQLILGLAETYGVDFKCKTITLTEKHSLLQKDEYDNVYEEMIPKISELWI
ncbi:AAA family ATPase [Tenacibaculum dicentrarchi]|uniref:AAA family ATPase n=1 Tax=Tenacibaculum dicentrarchi TaxID=669041 RepID=UPI00351366A3